MTRRDELARKLSEGGVPDPPEELLHRIKKDIPSELPQLKLDGELPAIRLYRTGWAVAASVLLLVAMSFIMLRVLELSPVRKQAVTADRAPLPETAVGSGGDSSVPEATPAASDHAALRSLPGKAASNEAAQQKTESRPVQVAAKEKVDQTSGFAADVVSTSEARKDQPQLEGGVPAATRDRERQEPVVAQSQKLAENPAPPTARSIEEQATGAVAAAPAPASAGAVAGARRQNAAKPALTTAPQPTLADSLSKSRKDEATQESLPANVSSFWFDGTTGSYDLIRSALVGRNELPSPQVVRVGEVINHFDYGDEIPRRGELAIHAEGTPDPFAVTSNTVVIRIAIRGRSPLPAGANVRVEFNPASVSGFRLIGYNERRGDDAPEIGTGQSITALYEVKLRPDVGRLADVATVRVRYAAPGDNRQTNEAERDIAMSDLSRSWSAAPPRLKLAVLVADWAEVLRRSSYGAAIDPDQLAARAEQLAGEFDGESSVNDFISLTKKTAVLIGGK